MDSRTHSRRRRESPSETHRKSCWRVSEGAHNVERRASNVRGLFSHAHTHLHRVVLCCVVRTWPDICGCGERSGGDRTQSAIKAGVCAVRWSAATMQEDGYEPSTLPLAIATHPPALCWALAARFRTIRGQTRSASAAQMMGWRGTGRRGEGRGVGCDASEQSGKAGIGWALAACDRRPARAFAFPPLDPDEFLQWQYHNMV